LSVSAAGDLALIRRHEMAIKRLQDQGSYAPYLSSYLFDVKQAKNPSTTETVSQWFRDDLNPFHKEEVEKILTAPLLPAGRKIAMPVPWRDHRFWGRGRQ
jgi:hypothetical protein